MKYFYQRDLPFNDNKRLAMDLHSREGPAIPVTVGEGLDRETVTYLYPDGSTLENVGGAFPTDTSEDKPASTNPADWQVVQWKDVMRRKIMYHTLVKQRADRRFKELYGEQQKSPTDEGVRELEQLFNVSVRAGAKIAQLERELAPPPPVLVPLTPTQQAEVKRTMERSAALHARVARLPAPKVSERAVVN